ncbi:MULTISPECIES: hypothetical protein [Mesorhizobium]|uniref:Uncharacterized protein n=3 Tax=Mesorhizobium TaxID=68287 RepID=Q8KGU7_RHILI|nr:MULTISPECIES: hypothetical protein [Mesorhizobium]MBZ9910195.1 hypothetical protein [Mesorhizobium sp. BR115XR7A]QJF04710.1 hypothetical protein R7A2020_29410 [Mesorhizobium japonicum R7A]QJF10779.1 hypothetical protein HID05_29400 [Mesorhizobium japonicum]QJI86652.1 hypothetical protein HKB46_29410 [Mesorhizobium japonicum]WQB97027.1 hypothetical protein U0R22_001133 [Mesorhizobium huakuii]
MAIAQLWIAGGKQVPRSSIALANRNRLVNAFECCRSTGLSVKAPGEREGARPDGATSNELFEVLADWNTQLEHLRPEVRKGAGP